MISPKTGVKARIFLPKINGPDYKKLLLVVHCHGGGFCIGSALDAITAPFFTHLVSEANVIAISIDYRLAPKHPLPIAFDDSWSALQWIVTHLNGTGPELWLNKYIDFEQVFLMGESAGVTIAHHVPVRIGSTPGSEGLWVCGVVIAHPHFMINEPDHLVPGE